MDRRHRLKRLISLQQNLKEVHEARQAAHLKEAANAESEASQIIERLEAEDSLAALFPDLYHERLGRALARKETNLKSAGQESSQVVAATARLNVVERAHREAVRAHERQTEEKALLDMLEQQRKK